MEKSSEVRIKEATPVARAETLSIPDGPGVEFFHIRKACIFTLIILAIASIFGTIVEQNQPPEKYQQVYEDWAYNLMDRINLFEHVPLLVVPGPSGPLHGEPDLLHPRPFSEGF